MTTVAVRDTQETRHAPGSPGYRRVMLAMFAAGVATFVLLYDTQALLPEFAEQFAVSPAAATLTVSLTTIGLAVALLVAGPVSEMLGRTPMIHTALWCSSLVAVAGALSPGWHALLWLRLIEGVTLAGLPAVATAYLREELHPRAHARAAGLYIGGTALGGMAGRLITAPIAEVAGWRWALAAAAGTALVCAALVSLLLPRSRHFSPRPRSLRSVAAMVRGATTDPALLSLYALGACSAGALVGVFNSLGFRLAAAPFGLGLGVVGLLYLVYPLGTASSVLSGRRADRLGRRAVLPVGCALALAGVALLATPSLPVIVAGLALLTTGFFVIHGLASGWVAARAHAVGASTSQAAAFYLCAYYLGSSIFGSLGGQLWSSHGWAGVTVMATALLLAGSLLTALLRRTPARA